MGLETVPVCDVFEVVRGVKRYQLTLRELEPDEQPDLEPTPANIRIENRVAYLGDRAYHRLLAKIDGGLKPPRKKADEAEQESE